MIQADLSLATRLELTEAATLVDYINIAQQVYPEINARYLRLASGAVAAYTGQGCPISRTSGLGLTGPASAQHLDEVEEFYASIGVPPQVDLCPLAHRSLVDLLNERGYGIRWFLNVHFLPLTTGVAWPASPTSIEVSEVGTGGIEQWALTVSNGFEGTCRDTLCHPCIAYVTGQKPGVHRFVAKVDGITSSAGVLEVRDRLAILCSTSTLPAFRNRGVQTALLHARLNLAISLGCNLVMVLTDPAGASQRNVARLGFRVAYTKIRMIGKS